MINKRIAICGKTCSGKNVIMRELIKMGVKPVVTCTTRPVRPGEKDGVDYYYLSDKEFMKRKENGLFLETTSYNTVHGVWHYGTLKDSLIPNSAIILNPDGVKLQKEIYGNEIVIFHIKASEETIRERLAERGDNPAEAERRIAADNEDFADIVSYIDYTIENENGADPKKIAETIMEIYKNH